MAKKIDRLFSDMASRPTKNGQRRMFNAYNWYRQRSEKIVKVDRKRMMEERKFKKTARPLIGKMYHFFYDPKMKQELPYYDRFPLILLVAPAPGGFYGINMHYLAPRQRAILMDELNKIAKKKTKGETDRILLSYELLKGASKLAAFRPCFKRYLNNHLVTPLREVPSVDWEKVLFLPTESFVGSSKAAVWKESLKSV